MIKITNPMFTHLEYAMQVDVYRAGDHTFLLRFGVPGAPRSKVKSYFLNCAAYIQETNTFTSVPAAGDQSMLLFYNEEHMKFLNEIIIVATGTATTPLFAEEPDPVAMLVADEVSFDGDYAREEELVGCLPPLQWIR